MISFAWFTCVLLYPFLTGNNLSLTGPGWDFLMILLSLDGFLHRRSCGEGLFRLFGFTQYHEQSAGLSRQAVNTADQGKNQGEEYQKPQAQ